MLDIVVKIPNNYASTKSQRLALIPFNYYSKYVRKHRKR